MLATPKLRDKAYKEINFEKVYYYEYEPQSKAEGQQAAEFDKMSLKIRKQAKTPLDTSTILQRLKGSGGFLDEYDAIQRPGTSIQGQEFKGMMLRRKNLNEKTT